MAFLGQKQIVHQLNIVDRPITKQKQEVPTVSLSAYTYLISELIQYCHKRVSSVDEFSDRLSCVGSSVGSRVAELMCCRETNTKLKRHTKLIEQLKYLKTHLWPYLFSKQADSLEMSKDHDDEYMLNDQDLLPIRYISVPDDLGSFHPGAFIAGIVQGLLTSSGFPAAVSAHFVQVAGQDQPRTTILMKFDQSVMKREAMLKKRGL